VWTNGDGPALAIFFIGISLFALLFGLLFTGKTWCNYICPLGLVEKIHTEPSADARGDGQRASGLLRAQR